MSYADSNVRAVSGTVDLAALNSWSTPIPLRRFGWSGAIERFTFRAPAGTAATEISVMVYIADEDAVITNPSTEILGENRVVYRTGIALAGSATVSDEDHVFSPRGAYDVEEYLTYKNDATQKILWVSFHTTAGAAQAGCSWRITASQVS